MTQELAAAPAHEVYAVPGYDRAVDDIVRWCRSGGEWNGKRLTLLNMPTDADRGRLAHRLRALLKANGHHDRKAVAAALAGMLTCYPNVTKGSGDLAADKAKLRDMIAKYTQEMHGIP